MNGFLGQNSRLAEARLGCGRGRLALTLRRMCMGYTNADSASSCPDVLRHEDCGNDGGTVWKQNMGATANLEIYYLKFQDLKIPVYMHIEPQSDQCNKSTHPIQQCFLLYLKVIHPVNLKRSPKDLKTMDLEHVVSHLKR